MEEEERVGGTEERDGGDRRARWRDRRKMEEERCPGDFFHRGASWDSTTLVESGLSPQLPTELSDFS